MERLSRQMVNVDQLWLRRTVPESVSVGSVEGLSQLFTTFRDDIRWNLLLGADARQPLP